MPFTNPFVPVNFINKSVTPTGTPDIDAAFLNYFQSIVDAQGDGLATYSSDLETLEATVGSLGNPFTDPMYINGLKVRFSTTTQIIVTSGACYVPATGNIVSKSTDTTINLTGLAADTWYYVYAIDTAGSLSFEYSTTQPVSYMGTASQKSGDSSRRYIGDFRTQSASTNIIRWRNVGNTVMFKPISIGWRAPPFQLESSKATTTLSTYQVTDGAGSVDCAPHLCRLVVIEGLSYSSIAGSQLVFGDPETLTGSVYDHFIEHGGGGRNNFTIWAALNDSGQIATRTQSATADTGYNYGVTGYVRER